MKSMIAENVSEIIIRDLEKLKTEISLFKVEENIWKVKATVTNSAGNLTLHLCGNLQHFIGAVLGGSGYIRNREMEFTLKNIPRTELLEEIERTIQAVSTGLNSITDGELYIDYPLEKNGKKSSKAFFLLHLVAHLNYHLGQVNYLRRILE
mgnify:CR=1 FL=1